MDEILRELVRLGFSEKEAAVYVASLEFGSATVQDISHLSKVNRATTYVTIDALTRRGLMSTFVKGKKRYYRAETPERLLSLIRVQRKELEEQESAFKNVLPMLFALFNVKGEKPQIRYLEGVEGLQTVRELFRNLEGEFVQIVPFDDVQAYPELTFGQSEHLARVADSHASYRALLVMREPDISKIPSVPNGKCVLFRRRNFLFMRKLPFVAIILFCTRLIPRSFL